MLRLVEKLFPSPKFHSDFGGLWIDRSNALHELKRRVRAGQVSAALGARIHTFIDDGYVVFPGAVDPTAVDHVADAMAKAFVHGDDRLFYHTDGMENLVPKPGTDPRGKRIVEAHAVLPEVRAVLSVPPLIAFLKAVFDEPPVLTQSLLFQNGSEQGFHQDPAYVVYDRPNHMVAAWVALEDVRAGCGELRYRRGSHRLPDYRFSTGRKDSHGARAGEVDAYLTWLVEECDKRGFAEERLIARKGDMLFWHAGLAHGGSPITDSALTRRSLVGHYCPFSVHPVYPHAETRRRDGELFYSTYLYDLDRLAPN